MKLMLYRGIAVPSAKASDVITDIERRGLQGDVLTWTLRVPDISAIRRDIDGLFVHRSAGSGGGSSAPSSTSARGRRRPSSCEQANASPCTASTMRSAGESHGRVIG